VTEFDPADLSSVDPAQFTTMVKSASKDQLEAVLASDSRAKILDEIFARFPAQFRADRAGSTNAVIHWNVTGRPDGGSDSYELVIADGACTLSPSADAEPKLEPVDEADEGSGAGPEADPGIGLEPEDKAEEEDDDVDRFSLAREFGRLLQGGDGPTDS